MRHFLRDDDLAPDEQTQVLMLAREMKANPFAFKPLAGPQSVATIYEKQTLRTQTSFAAGIAELGGNPMLVDGTMADIGNRESIADVARILGRQVSLIVWRTYGQDRVEEMAACAGVPVVNALTDDFHPCQLLADLLTIQEHKGSLKGVTATFVGDAACNMGNSWALAGVTAGMHIRFGAPAGYYPSTDVLVTADVIAAHTGGSVTLADDPMDAVKDADVVITDTWISMGKEAETAERLKVFSPYAVTAEVFAAAKPDAIAMHCLPAYRGKEIAAEVLDGPHSVVWDEAENRRHAQKAIMAFLLEQAVNGQSSD